MSDLRNSKILMTGDSITDCGRMRDAQNLCSPDALGNGYVSYTNAYLKVFKPELNIKIANTGISGNTSRHILKRWETDVLNHGCDYISLLIGVNDIWRKYDAPESGEHVPADEYEKNVRSMVEASLKAVKGFYIMTPFYIHSDKNDPMKRDVDAYAEIIRRISDNYKISLIDLNLKFDKLLEETDYTELAADRVHPNSIAHMVIMKEFLTTTKLI